MKKHYDIIIVGAGISGCTLAERYATQLHKKVLIIEKRDHVGGNCFDFINSDGILVSKYGPHYFHTNSKEVFEYVSEFTEWIPYEHKVISHVDDIKVPVPVNIKTVNNIFKQNIQTKEQFAEWIKNNIEKIDIPKNSEESALKRVGKVLYEKMFKNYTIKQWDRHPRELEPEVMNRIPVRDSFDDRYFTDIYQYMPKNGYTKIFENMLQSKNIDVLLDSDWSSVLHMYTYDKLFYTGRIDSFFDKKLGKLEYRSLKFEFETFNQEFYQEYAQENYPSLDILYTRIVEYKIATGQKHPKTTISKEYPTWEGEPYYPVPSEKNRTIYSRYQKKSEALMNKGIYFVGRLANYKYFNMDEAFKNALDVFDKIEFKK